MDRDTFSGKRQRPSFSIAPNNLFQRDASKRVRFDDDCPVDKDDANINELAETKKKDQDSNVSQERPYVARKVSTASSHLNASQSSSAIPELQSTHNTQS